MKKIVFIALTALLLVGCKKTDKYYDEKIPNGYHVVVIDSCEYINAGYGYGQFHKGNCKYCEQRRKKEQKELIQKIYEQQTKK